MALAALVGAPALFVLFMNRGRVVRTLLAAVLGLMAAAAGLAAHVAHALLNGPGAGDYTGIAVALAGIVLIGLAFRTALRGRPRRVKALAIPVLVVVVQWFVVPVMTAGVVTNGPRHDVPSAGTFSLAGARDASFRARDGVRLAGWYMPGRNGSAVVLMHGSHGTRADTLDHLRMLTRAGYAVLAFDGRGHGDSAGQTNALGWCGADGVSGAVAFLQRQDGIDPQRIAALGLSMGGEEALRAAGDGVPLAAVVADGAGASTSGDQALVQSAPISRSVEWLGMRATELFSGETEPPSLNSEVRAIRAPVLLIASNAPDEVTLDRAYRRRIGPSADLWYVPDAAHTKALDRHPAAYPARIATFVEAALSR